MSVKMSTTLLQSSCEQVSCSEKRSSTSEVLLATSAKAVFITALLSLRIARMERRKGERTEPETELALLDSFTLYSFAEPTDQKDQTDQTELAVLGSRLFQVVSGCLKCCA